MINKFFLLIVVFSASNLFGQDSTLTIDSIQQIILNDNPEIVKNSTEQIGTKKYDFLNFKYDNAPHMAICNSGGESKDDLQKYLQFDHTYGVFMRLGDELLLLRDATIKNLCKTTKIIRFDSHMEIVSVMYFHAEHLIGISLFNDLDYGIEESFCLINLSFNKHWLRNMTLGNLTDTDWIKSIFNLYEKYHSNTLLYRKHTIEGIYNVFLGEN